MPAAALSLLSLLPLALAAEPDEAPPAAVPTAEVPAPEAPPAAVPDPEALPTEPAAAAPDDAEAHYLAGLAAWKRRDHEVALAEARAALALDPSLAAARLLEAYALLRADAVDEAVGKLEKLARDAEGEDPEVARRATQAARRITDRRRRDQLSLAVGHMIGIETMAGNAPATAGPAFDVEVPVFDRFGVRAQWVMEWSTGRDLLDFGGPTAAVLATAHQPLGRGVWSVDAGVGPTLWFARGGYWETGSEQYLGVRGALGLDARFSRRVGLRAEVGTKWFPTVTDVLPGYGQPLDTRVELIWWLGR